MTPLQEAFERERFRRAATSVLSAARPGDQPVDWSPLGRGNSKETALVSFDDGPPLVVQLSTEPAALRSERVLLETVAERTTVPVPAVAAADTVDGVAALATAYVPGADLHERFVAMDDATRRAIAASFGQYLAALHDRVRFDGYGTVTVADGTPSGLAASDDDWADWLESYGRAGLARLPAAFDDLRPALSALFDRPRVAGDPPARLFPWDFRPGNALVADGEVAAVLDWERPLAAAPALSVAKATYLVVDWYVEDTAPLREAFVDGYERVRPFPTVRPVHRAAAVCRSAVDSTGAVTNPGYPERGREEAVAFHRTALARALDGGRL